MEQIKKSKSNTFKVQIKFPETSLCTFAILEDEDQAIGLALSLHKSSNQVHQVFVDTGEEVICMLNLYPFE